MRLLPAELPGDLGPRGFPQWRAVITTAALDGIELIANEDSGGRVRNFWNAPSLIFVQRKTFRASKR